MRLEDFVPDGSSAIAVMTDGRFLGVLAADRLKRDLGHRPGARSDKVVIYYRHEGRNRVYVGDHLATVPSA
ncbi:MAG: hypothetical protein M5U12_17525 [Verrucomicrobia bacterium]|nr:hypothetical protein [Verrucomicrobiota bacterium]